MSSGNHAISLDQTTKKRTARKPVSTKPSDNSVGKTPPRFVSFYPSPDRGIPVELAPQVDRLSECLGVPVLVLSQAIFNGSPRFGTFNDDVCDAIEQCTVNAFERGNPIAVLLQSAGGQADAAYRIARYLRKRFGGFKVVIPRYAKSAATLFALGADEIIMGDFAELGPLDVQLHDSDREQRMSALEVVHAVGRLNAESMDAIDVQMFHWAHRCGKKMEFLLPVASHFVAEMMAPLFEKIDAVQFTQMSRLLKVGQDYAERLLLPMYGESASLEIASALTENYSDHGFVIDRDEAVGIGLKCEEPKAELSGIIEDLRRMMPTKQTVIGTVLPLEQKKERVPQ